MTEGTYTMSVGRDYRTSLIRYEYVIYLGEEIFARAGSFKTSTAAKRAGLKVARQLSLIGE